MYSYMFGGGETLGFLTLSKREPGDYPTVQVVGTSSNPIDVVVLTFIRYLVKVYPYIQTFGLDI